MKNTFFFFLFSLVTFFSAEAQKKTAVSVKQLNVPENVKSSFKSQFGDIQDSKWDKNYSGNYIASFTNSEKLQETAEYSQSGAMIKSKVAYSPASLPENVSHSLASQYATAKVTECTRLQLPGVAPYYKVKISNADNTVKELLISEEGTVTE